MNDQKRDILRKTILEFLKNSNVHYTDIEKKCISTSLPFATSNTFRRQFYDYLLRRRYIKRVSRGVYTITNKGNMLLAVL